MFNLSGKTALVTGASGGIGGAIAKALAGQGARVALSGTRVEALEKLKAELGGDHPIAPCNLSDAAAVDGLVGQAEQALGGRLDILVANAGITKDGLMLRMKDEDFQNVLKINLESYFRLSRAALRNMMKNRWGRIVGITSVVGVTGNPGQANYAASKAGMIGFTKALAAEVASRNVTANCVAPGFIASPMTDVLNDAQKSALMTKIPAGRLGEGLDVAAAVAFLASEEASYITGQTLHVNGGMAMI
jgi:3-oxoacyl-[acyl-carrier protein] reductase